MGFQQMAVEQDGASVKITVAGQAPEYIQAVNIQHVAGNTINFTAATEPEEATSGFQKGELYPHDVMWRVTMQMIDGTSMHFDIQDVSNQAGWTANAAGLAQALSDINSWLP